MIDIKATLNNLHNVLPGASAETLLKLIDAIVEDNTDCPTITFPQIYYSSITNPFKIMS